MVEDKLTDTSKLRRRSLDVLNAMNKWFNSIEGEYVKNSDFNS